MLAPRSAVDIKLSVSSVVLLKFLTQFNRDSGQAGITSDPESSNSKHSGFIGDKHYLHYSLVENLEFFNERSLVSDKRPSLPSLST
jgi:hypothetical protein